MNKLAVAATLIGPLLEYCKFQNVSETGSFSVLTWCILVVCISHVGLNDWCYLLVKLSLMFQSYVCSAYLMAVLNLSCNFAKVEVYFGILLLVPGILQAFFVDYFSF